MKYEFSFYKTTDYEELIKMAIASYHWSVPTVGVSRIEFAMGFHPAFTGNKHAWEHTTGVYRLEGSVVAAVQVMVGKQKFSFHGKKNPWSIIMRKNLFPSDRKQPADCRRKVSD